MDRDDSADPLAIVETYDLIVIGLGAVGSAALCQSALRGARVLGIDRFPPAT